MTFDTGHSRAFRHARKEQAVGHAPSGIIARMMDWPIFDPSERNDANQPHAAPSDVIGVADEGADKRCVAPESQQAPRRRKTKGHIRHCAASAQVTPGFQFIRRRRHLDARIVSDFAKDIGFGHDLVVIGSRHFGAARPRYKSAYVLYDALEISTLLSHQRGVRRHPITRTAAGENTYFRPISGIDENFIQQLPGSHPPGNAVDDHRPCYFRPQKLD